MIYDEQTRSAMNYYEELGVGQDATEPEIRKAHRRLVKLMHPDAQPDQSLKMLAETQMRRLNSIVSTLLDSEQRRSYDEQLSAAAHPLSKQSILPSWQGIPWWLASAVGAVVLTLAAVWLWADHLGNSFGPKSKAAYNPSRERTPVVSLPPAVSKSPSVIEDPHPPQDAPSGDKQQADPAPGNDGVSTAVVPDLQPDAKKPPVVADNRAAQPPMVVPPVQKADAVKPSVLMVPVKDPSVKKPSHLDAKSVTVDVSKKPSQPEPTPAQKKLFNLPAGSVIARAVLPAGKGSGSQLPSPPGVVSPSSHDYNSVPLPSSPLPAVVPPNTPQKLAVVTTGAGTTLMASRDPLEGEWVYSPKEPEKRKAGFYPPEFIDLKIFGAGDPGSLKGQYNAKYVVTDRPVTPEVSFELASISKGSRKFVWQSNTGAKGTFSIDPIDDRTIRIDWHTTSAVSGPTLTSGTATLVRRQ